MKDEEEILDAWQRRTDRVSAGVFDRYFLDGNTRRLAALRRLEDAFDKVRREVRGTTVGDVPAVWMLYNMGVVVKTREAVFSIDLHHRRAAELAPLLDFALITHNHDDHWRQDFYRAMDRAGKTVQDRRLELPRELRRGELAQRRARLGGRGRLHEGAQDVPHPRRRGPHLLRRPQRLPGRLHDRLRGPRREVDSLPHGRLRQGERAQAPRVPARPVGVLPGLRHRRRGGGPPRPPEAPRLRPPLGARPQKRPPHRPSPAQRLRRRAPRRRRPRPRPVGRPALVTSRGCGPSIRARKREGLRNGASARPTPPRAPRSGIGESPCHGILAKRAAMW